MKAIGVACVGEIAMGLAQLSLVEKLAGGPITKAAVEQVMETSCITAAVFGASVVLPTASVLEKLRTAVLRVVHSEQQEFREAHCVLVTTLRTHRVDAWSAIVYQSLRNFKLLADEDAETLKLLSET